MGSFKREDRRSGGSSFGRGFSGGKSFGGKSFGSSRPSFGGRDGGRPAMFKAVCSECGDDCDIPFKPTSGRPVFCSNCFAKQGDRGGSSRSTSFGGGERRERPRFEDRQMTDAVCDKCGKDCQVPFRPTEGKPVFCSDCFEKTGDRGGERRNRDNGGNGSNEVMEQIKQLNNKIDKLISILAPKETKKEVKKEAEVKEVKVTKEVKKEKKEKVAPKKVVAKKKK